MDNLPITPEQFLSAFFDAGDIVCPRVFSDRRDTTFRGQKYQCDMGRFGELVETLHKQNELSRGGASALFDGFAAVDYCCGAG